MRLFDTPMLFNRTGRELVLIGLGLGACAFTATQPQFGALNLVLAGIVTALFATRYYAARAISIGILFSALVFHLAHMRYGDNWLGVRDSVPWFVYLMLAMLALLTSRDLVRRFDLADGSGWRHNPWRERPRSHWIGACLGGYAIGTLANLLLSLWIRNGLDTTYWWLPVACGVAVVSLLLMFRAHKLGYVLALAIAVGACVITLPHVGGAESYLANGWHTHPEWTLWRSAPHLALPIAILASITAALSVAMLAARRR